MEEIKIKIKKTKDFFKRLFYFFIERVFLTCLLLFFISLIFGAFLFYKYNILVHNLEPTEETRSLLWKEDVYKKILGVWQKEDEKFKEAETKEYFNPFNNFNK